MREKRTLNTLPRSSAGFSLIELAIALLIITILMSGVVVSISQMSANARITASKAQLLELREALYGFAQANGRLPCPATESSNGKEDPVIGGNCTRIHGFLPVATLDVSGAINGDGLLLDPWQNPIRYSVAPFALGATSSFTDTAELDTLFNTAPTSFVGNTNMLTVCDDAACTTNTLADSAPAVIFSMGANWPTYSSTDEIGNSGDGTMTLIGPDTGNVYNMTIDNSFVSRTYSEENFDDQIVWLSPYVLFDRLIDAGKLP